MRAYVLANFGGPRNGQEIPSFLKALLTDRDLIRTNLPGFFHRLLFSRIAKRRVEKVAHEYADMGFGGGSPIYEDTEALAKLLQPKLDGPLLTFHRYLTETHASFIEKMAELNADEIRVLPLFPQFTYATTGSVARFFADHLPWEVARRLRWIRSYPDDDAFIAPFTDLIQKSLNENNLAAKDAFFLFSAHGIPKSYVESGDLYLEECMRSKEAIMQLFPEATSLLAFQSEFGKAEWLKPSTKELSADVGPWIQGKKALLFLPISFTSDHIETIQEVGKGYLLQVERQGVKAIRVPTVALHPLWVEGCLKLFKGRDLVNNQMLIRTLGCKGLCPGCRKVCRK